MHSLETQIKKLVKPMLQVISRLDLSWQRGQGYWLRESGFDYLLVQIGLDPLHFFERGAVINVGAVECVFIMTLEQTKTSTM